MSTNYRVFHTQYAVQYAREKTPHMEQWYTIRDVYYDDEDGSIIGCSAGDVLIGGQGDTLEGLRGDLQKMLRAFSHPVLTPKDIPGYRYERDEIPFDDEKEMNNNDI